ncbi:hypothetical protein GCM10009690_26810 [Brevibacterium permense]|uniref:FAD-dependent oxidoreductase 2 FAD-binding domain-containing protein n=1 Tax=Brevibacterium permense TaxID=234834 RepID=A0ABN2AM57_9MICO
MESQMLDITASAIEIAPTAHSLMGGVWVDPVDHSTNVEGLWAISAASSGLHGVNRLSGNSLIELLVFGRIVGRSAVAYSDSLEAQVRSHAAVDEARAEICDLLESEGRENVCALQREVRNLMTEHPRRRPRVDPFSFGGRRGPHAHRRNQPRRQTRRIIAT